MNIGHSKSSTARDSVRASAPVSDGQTREVHYRTTTYRLLPGTRRRAELLRRTGGCLRKAWNTILDRNRQAYQAWKDGKREDKPGVSHFDLCKEFTKLRNEPEFAYMQEVSHQAVRSGMKRLSLAFKAAFRDGGFPKFKDRRGDDSFAIVDTPKVREDAIFVPMIGWLTARRNTPDPCFGTGKAKQIVVRQEGEKWLATVMWELPGRDPSSEPAEPTVGIDRNLGQITCSDDALGKVALPDLSRLFARKRRHQKRMSRQTKGSNRRKVTKERHRKTCRKIANSLDNAAHQATRRIADRHHAVALEDLNIKAMTKKGRGRRSRDMNRRILASIWGKVEQQLGYKTHVVKVNPAHTSQRCFACGHVAKANRRSQSEFVCATCGHADNADRNASLNILRDGVREWNKASGIGAAARGGAKRRRGRARAGPATTPVRREHDISLRESCM